MAAPVFGVTDVLGLGADWEPQSNSPTLNTTRATAAGGNGDIVAENGHNDIESGTASYIYVGAETGFIAALLAAAALPGQLADSDTLLITGVAIDYSPCAAGKRPLVTFTYRDGPTAAPATPYWYTSDLTLPTYVAANLAVPTLLTVTAGDAECQNCQWSLQAQFGEDLDKDGDYLAGACYGGEESVNLTFVGLPTSITSTGWIQTAGPGTNTGANASNTGYGTNAYTFIRKVTRATA